MILRRAISAGAVACRPGAWLAGRGACAELLRTPVRPARRPQYAAAAPPPQYRPSRNIPPQPASPTLQARNSGGRRPAGPALGSSRPPPAGARRPPRSRRPPPYEKELLRLAEIIGSLAFLRSLCTTPDATEWPQRMQLLLDAEGTTPGRKERLAGAYNKGYQAFAVTYRVCTPSATEATTRYLREGDTCRRSLSGRYGG